MSLQLAPGMRLPFFRLATPGGNSVSRDDFLGKSTLYVGWASWDVSRESLPALQAFHEKHRDLLRVVPIAFDVQGPEPPMKRLVQARFSSTALIDACCELSRQWGVRAIPFSILVDTNATVLLTGGAPDGAFLKKAVQAAARKPSKPGKDRPVAHRFEKFEFLLQSCINLLGRARKEDALATLGQALALEPENGLVRPQMWAIAHPEKFYAGPVDLEWQRGQVEASRKIPSRAKHA